MISVAVAEQAPVAKKQTYKINPTRSIYRKLHSERGVRRREKKEDEEFNSKSVTKKNPSKKQLLSWNKRQCDEHMAGSGFLRRTHGGAASRAITLTHRYRRQTF